MLAGRSPAKRLKRHPLGVFIMGLPHRIAAGGLIFKDNSVLLVRYCDEKAGTYLAGPGGALEDDENIVQAIIRETREETNIIVKPKRVVYIEDLIGSKYKMSKTWMICEFVDGSIKLTEEAKREGIIEIDWFNRSQLKSETVYPDILLQYSWKQLISDIIQVECPPTRTAAI
jgi:8-oxo-dGTP diphosphatase